MDGQGKIAFQDINAVKKNLSTSGTINAGTSISRVNRTSGFSQKSHLVSPYEISEAGKPSECVSRHQSNSITNYFQVARKRYVNVPDFTCLIVMLMLFLENNFNLRDVHLIQNIIKKVILGQLPRMASFSSRVLIFKFHNAVTKTPGSCYVVDAASHIQKCFCNFFLL